MKPAQVKELRTHLTGAIADTADVREHFATDGGMLTIVPAAAVYPLNPAEVGAMVAYAADQSTKAGKHLSLVPRGTGGGMSGGALGEGLVVVFPAHLSQPVHLSKDTVTVQSGMTAGALQRLLRSHGRRLALPAAFGHYSLGGLVASGVAGSAVKRLRVVLDDGSEVETRPLSGRELNRKKGLMTREGDLYRGLDGMLKDHKAMLAEAAKPGYDTAGYRLQAIKQGGSFDLSQLMIGAEGTLGLITEITLHTVPLADRTTLVVGRFDTAEAAAQAILKLQLLRPSRLELANRELLDYVQQHQPEVLEKLAEGLALSESAPELVVWAEFDHLSHLRQNLLGRRAERIMRKQGGRCMTVSSATERSQLWAPLQVAPAALWIHSGIKKPLPILDDISVPFHQLPEFLPALAKLLLKHKVEAVMWGQAEIGSLHVQPLIDLSKPKGRKTAMALMDEVYGLVMKHDGTIAAGSGVGRLKAPYVEKQVGHELYQLLKEVKQLCDPQGIFNPGVKLGTTKKEVEARLRHDYTRRHQYGHLSQL
jgi:FAD/FMN-containing dehydrogenase